MKILSNKKYRELTSRILTLEKAAGEQIKEEWNAGYDTGVTSGRAVALADARQQFVEKLRAMYLEAPSEQTAKLLLAYDALQASHVLYNPPYPFYGNPRIAAAQGLTGVLGKAFHTWT